jgi:hypothetical protein
MSQERLSKLNVDLINPKNSLLKSQKFNDILVLLKQKIAEYPSNHIFKQCNEFLLYVCKVVEEVVVKADKINKKEFVVDIFKLLFGINDANVCAFALSPVFSKICLYVSLM